MDGLGLEHYERTASVEYFEMKLGKDSEDFLMLKRLVEESRGKISWDDLKEYTVVKDKKVEGIYREGDLDLRGTGTLKDLGELKEIKGDLNLIGTSVDVQLKVIEKINKGELQVKGEIYFGGDIDGIERLLEEENIPGNLDLRWTSIRSLGKLKRVGGNLNLYGVGTLEDLGELEEVGGYLYLNGTRISTLGKLKKVGGKLNLGWVGTLNDLGELEEVGWDLYLGGTRIRSLGKLKRVGGNLDLNGVGTLEDLGELEEVGGNLYLEGTRIRSLGELQRVGGNLDLNGVGTLEDLGELEEVGGNLDLRWTSVEVQLEVIRKINKGELQVKGEIYFGGDIDGIERLLEKGDIPGNLDLRGTSIRSLGKLKKVRGELNLEGVGTLEDLGELEEVGGYLYLRGTDISTLGKLKKVGGNLYLEGVGTLEDLGELEEVGGDLYLIGTSVDVQLGAIRKINEGELRVKGKIYFGGDIDGIERLLEEENIPGDLYLRGTNIESLGKLKKVGGNLNLYGVDTLEDLGELEEVGGDLYLRLTRIEVQLEALKKKKEGKLVVKGELYVDKLIEEIMSVDLEINFGNLESKYGNNVDDIGDEEIKGIIIGILTWWLGYKKREVTKEIAEIIGKEGLSKEDKIKAILKLDRKYQELKQKLEGYGISLDK